MKNRVVNVLCFALLITGMISCISYRTRPTQLYNEVINGRKTFDVAIVPGVPFKDGKWDTIMKGRVLWADHLYKSGIVKNIIFSGGAVYTPYYEAKIMGLYAQAMGIPAANIFYETDAEHSTENIYYSYEMARKLGFKSIALVTDPFQSSLTKRFTRKRFTTHIQHIPFMVDTIRKRNYHDFKIDPQSAYNPEFKSIVERESRLKRFRGTLGAFIPWQNMEGRKAAPL